jgi:peroxiredoxin
MSILNEFAKQKPDGVAVVRVDVPLPGESLLISPSNDDAFPRFSDSGRLVASELDFFYYPTLYVFDGDGIKRFAGGCDKDLVIQMVQEIIAEQPGHTKKIYTLRMPEIGTQAPSFSGSTSANERVALNALLGESGLLIFFSKASCPFSTKELPHLKDIVDTVHSKGVSTVIINQKETAATDNSVYEIQCAGVPVVQDQTGKIFESFGVDATPFFYLLDKHARIIKHRSFTHAAAMNSVNAMLGLEPEKHRFESTKAG